jgi:hypothetical protein
VVMGSKTPEDMDICLLWVLYVVRERSLRRADHSSRGVLPSVVRLSECDREASIMRRPWSTKGCCAIGNKNCILHQQSLLAKYRRKHIGTTIGNWLKLAVSLIVRTEHSSFQNASAWSKCTVL